MYDWTNHLRVGIYTCIFYIAVLFMCLQFPPDSVLNDPAEDAVYAYSRKLETALWGILPTFLLGMALSWLRLAWFHQVVLVRFRCASHEAGRRHASMQLRLLGPLLPSCMVSSPLVVPRRDAPPGTKSRKLFRFTDARQVEILARCCRK